jgi:hypothetical protein
VGTVGNTGRDSLRGPSFFNTNISLSKDNKLSELFRLQFRAEFFNIFNHENLFFPNSMVFNPKTEARSELAGKDLRQQGDGNKRDGQTSPARDQCSVVG